MFTTVPVKFNCIIGLKMQMTVAHKGLTEAWARPIGLCQSSLDQPASTVGSKMHFLRTANSNNTRRQLTGYLQTVISIRPNPKEKISFNLSEMCGYWLYWLHTA